MKRRSRTKGRKTEKRLRRTSLDGLQDSQGLEVSDLFMLKFTYCYNRLGDIDLTQSVTGYASSLSDSVRHRVGDVSGSDDALTMEFGD